MTQPPPTTPRLRGLARLRRRKTAPDARVDRSQAAADRRQLRLGAAGAAVLAAILVATAAVYVLPVGQRTYAADLAEADSIAAGSDVRVAGITVGKVTDLRLGADRVHMTFTVDHDVFVGDQTTLDIRMLTIVGGHYVALRSAGSQPLGSATIPADRVRLPYSLVRALRDASTPIDQVDGATLRRTMIELQTALESSPDALRQAGRAADTMISMLNAQDVQVSRTLQVTDEYLTLINANKSLLGTFIRKVAQLTTRGLAKRAEVSESTRLTNELLSRIAAMEPTWREAMQPVFHKLTEAQPQMTALTQRLDETLAALTDLSQRLQQGVGPDGPMIDQSAVTVCVPIPGRGC